MKKLVVLAVCLMVVASGAFSLDKAAGGGLLFNASSTSGEDVYDEKWTMTRTGFGAFGFFGLGRFFELNLGLLYKNPNELKVTYEGQTYTFTDSDINIDPSAALQFGLYGKYPIPISDMFVFFPTGGIDFEISLNDEEWENGWKWWHDLWLRAGVGLDVFFTERMFLRTHAIYGVAIPVGGNDEIGIKIGHGFLLKVGLGWMF